MVVPTTKQWLLSEHETAASRKPEGKFVEADHGVPSVVVSIALAPIATQVVVLTPHDTLERFNTLGVGSTCQVIPSLVPMMVGIESTIPTAAQSVEREHET